MVINRAAAGSMVLLALATGCATGPGLYASIQTEARREVIQLGTETVIQRPSDWSLLVTGDLEGGPYADGLVLTVLAKEIATCDVETQARSQEVDIEERRIVSGGFEPFLYAAGLGLAGLSFFALAPRADPEIQDGYIIMGYLSLAAGGGALAVGVYDRFAARDRRIEHPEVSTVVGVQAVECERRPVVRLPIAVRVSGQEFDVGETDSNGRIVVSVAETGAPVHHGLPWARLVVDGQEIATLELPRSALTYASALAMVQRKLHEPSEHDPSAVQAEFMASYPDSPDLEQLSGQVEEALAIRRAESAGQLQRAEDLIHEGELEEAQLAIDRARELGADVAAVEEQFRVRREAVLEARRAEALEAWRQLGSRELPHVRDFIETYGEAVPDAARQVLATLEEQEREADRRERERPPVARSPQLQAAINALCRAHMEPDRPAGPRVFGVPVNATLPQLACLPDPDIRECHNEVPSFPLGPVPVHVNQHFPLERDSRALPAIRCRGPQGTWLSFSAIDGELLTIGLKPLDHDVAWDALLRRLEARHGRSRRLSRVTGLPSAFGERSADSFQIPVPSTGGRIVYVVTDDPGEPRELYEPLGFLFRHEARIRRAVQRAIQMEREEEDRRAQQIVP